MNRIELRGIIVPSIYDCDYMKSYIERGILTPESSFRRAVAKLAANEDMELYVNSQGGSVFAGAEMINALLQWKKETGKKIVVVVGALAASMAANTIVQVADEVRLHVNSKIMFHGATGIQFGGAEAFKDYSELLDKINADVKTILIQRYDLSPDAVEQWFAEGREGWISAKEAVRIGMASEIIGEFAADPEAPENQEALLNERGVRIAAVVFSRFQSIKQQEVPMFEKLKQALFGKGLQAEADESAAEEFVRQLATPEEMAEKIEAAKTEAAEAAEARIAELETEKSDLAAKIEGLETQAKADADARVKLEADLKAAEEKLESLSNGLNAPPDGEPETGMKAFFQAVEARMERDGIGREDATLAVQRENPELFQSMIEEANKK